MSQPAQEQVCSIVNFCNFITSPKTSLVTIVANFFAYHHSIYFALQMLYFVKSFFIFCIFKILKSEYVRNLIIS